jgi:hypothetical protein
MPESISKTMNISTFTLGALLASASGTQAQTAYKDSLQTDTVKNSKTPAAQITEKYNQSQIQKTKEPTTTEHKRRHCPTCGRG